jgi:hypothetical protein
VWTADKLRVAGSAGAAILIVLASAVVLDWFTLGASVGNLGSTTGGIGLRRLEGILATFVFWSSLAVAVVVAVQAGSRLTGRAVNSNLTKAGFTLATWLVIDTFLAAYLFAPDNAGMTATIMDNEVTIQIQRTMAPLVTIIGAVVSMVALYYAATEETASLSMPAPAPTPRPALPSQPLQVDKQASTPIPVATQDRPSGPLSAIPEKLRGKLNYSALTLDVSKGGLDGVRTDGKAILVGWREIVGAVARRLPPEYDGATFIDIVSTAGNTLRITPWTRVTGFSFSQLSDTARVLAFVADVIRNCPDITLDPATRKFVETRGEPVQLPDLTTLAAHDERLA